MKLLGIDYGEKRIGLALGENGICTPLGVLEKGGLEEKIRKIKEIVKESGVDCIVLGVPKSPRGFSRKQEYNVNKFYEVLRNSVNLPIKKCDESFTSKDAIGYLYLANKKKRHIDDISACLILEKFFDECIKK